MLMLPQLFLGQAKDLLIGVDITGLFTSPDGLRYTRTVTTPKGSYPGGYSFRESVAVNGFAYVPDQSGRIYKTTDFRNFVEVTINDIPNNNGQKQFSSGAHLFKRQSLPNRIYAVSYSLFGGDRNDRVSIWYSDDGCVNWTSLYQSAISASTQCRCIVEATDGNFYLSISFFGSGTTLERVRISDGGVTGGMSSFGGGCLLFSNGVLYATNSNSYMPISSFGTVLPAPSLPPNISSGFWGATNIINGTIRHCIISRNNSTGRLAMAYLDSADFSAGTWQLGNVPNISVTSIGSSGYSKVVSLGIDKGFAAAYFDSPDATNSGALISPDGITWQQASLESPAFNAMANIQLNPLLAA